MDELLRARAERNTLSVSKYLVLHRVFDRLPRQVRNRIRALASGTCPPCPTDVRMVDQIVDFAACGVLPL